MLELHDLSIICNTAIPQLQNLSSDASVYTTNMRTNCNAFVMLSSAAAYNSRCRTFLHDAVYFACYNNVLPNQQQTLSTHLIIDNTINDRGYNPSLV